MVEIPLFFTPLKINMEPKNEGLEDDYPFQTGDVQVNHVHFQVATQRFLIFTLIWGRFLV